MKNMRSRAPQPLITTSQSIESSQPPNLLSFPFACSCKSNTASPHSSSLSKTGPKCSERNEHFPLQASPTLRMVMRFKVSLKGTETTYVRGEKQASGTASKQQSKGAAAAATTMPWGDHHCDQYAQTSRTTTHRGTHTCIHAAPIGSHYVQAGALTHLVASA